MLRGLFYFLIVKPITGGLLGTNVQGREHLPESGPAILVANHNSHLDTLVLMALFPSKLQSHLRPVAAADYFSKNRCLNWFATQVLNIIPIERKPELMSGDLLKPIISALDEKKILIFFPEGTRGEPENMGKFKSGIAHVLAQRPTTKVIPIYLAGLGKCLPKGEFLLVPFFIDVFVGCPLPWCGERRRYMNNLRKTMTDLQERAKAKEIS